MRVVYRGNRQHVVSALNELFWLFHDIPAPRCISSSKIPLLLPKTVSGPNILVRHDPPFSVQCVPLSGPHPSIKNQLLVLYEPEWENMDADVALNLRDSHASFALVILSDRSNDVTRSIFENRKFPHALLELCAMKMTEECGFTQLEIGQHEKLQTHIKRFLSSRSGREKNEKRAGD